MKNKSDLVIPIETPLIDSLSIMLPFHQCSIIDKRLENLPMLFYPDIVDQNDNPYTDGVYLSNQPIIIAYHGIKLRFSLVSLPNPDDRTKSDRFISITLNAKLLKERYFEGISKDNLLRLYNQIIDFDVIQFSFESFKNAKCNDVDICYNVYVPSLKHFIEAIKLCQQDAGEKSKYLKPFIDTAKGNYGLNFNQRQFAKPSLPFIKLYNKEFELLNKSADFWNIYLFKHFGSQIRNLTRVEATIKNYAHKRRLNKYGIIPMFKTLDELLEIDKQSLVDFIVFSKSSYIGKWFKMKSPNLSPQDHIIFELIQKCILNGASTSELLDVAETFKGTSDQTTRNAKTRIRKKIKQLSNMILKNNEKLSRNNNLNNDAYEYLKRTKLK